MSSGRMELTAEARPAWKQISYQFMSDHGLAVGYHGLVGERNQYDDSVRVPFMITGPGVKTGRTMDTRIELQDVMIPDWFPANRSVCERPVEQDAHCRRKRLEACSRREADEVLPAN